MCLNNNFMLRETMAEWFAKHGFNVFGLVEVRHMADGVKQVRYYLYISNDASNDTRYVLCCVHNRIKNLAGTVYSPLRHFCQILLPILIPLICFQT